MRFTGLALAFWGSLCTASPVDAAGRCTYDAVLRDAAELALSVAARCEGVAEKGFSAGRGVPMDAFEDLQRDASGETVSYRIRLGELAKRGSGADVAQRVGDMVVTTLPIWLLQPEDADARVELKLRAEDGLDFAVNLTAKDGRYLLSPEDIAYGGYAAFGRFTRERIAVGDGAIDIAHTPGSMPMDAAEVKQAVGEAAAEIARFYGRFPVKRLLVLALPGGPRSGMEFGRVRGGGGATMMLRFGTLSRAADLRREWVLVHEMSHVGGPFVTPRGFWLMEGMATYVEPVVRTRAGWYAPEELWREFARDMARGVDALTRESLNAVTRRGVYWGGALFMLLADLDIRERSKGRASLETCLRAVLAVGGDTTQRWTKERVFQVCDAATGTGTMRRLADAYVERSGELDIAALWRDLGVDVEDGQMRFDDTAPRAALRRAITSGPAVN